MSSTPILDRVGAQTPTTHPSAVADAVLAFSGGQDSTTLLAWACHRFGEHRVRTIGFRYGQRHSVELEQAAAIAEKFGVPFAILDVAALGQLGAAALTSPHIEVEAEASEGSGNEHAARGGLPSTFVPGRNLLFLGLVGAYAAQHDIPNIITGICEADEAGYPDCRLEFAQSMETTLNLAMGLPIRVPSMSGSGEPGIHLLAPLLTLDKADTWRLADELNVKDVIVNDTHTCYRGEHDTLHDWGYGCATCPACVERMKGYAEAFDAPHVWDEVAAAEGED